MSEPAPIERVTFYAELARRRHQGWLFSAICVLVSAGVGLVLSPIVTPIVLLVLGGLAKLAIALGVGGALAPSAVAAIHGFAVHHSRAFEALIDRLDLVHGVRDLGVLAAPMARLAPLAVPALVAGAMVWWGLRGLFMRAAGEDLIARLGARPARADDLEERQVANIFEEIALGAGAPAPKLFLIDSPAINAASLGRSPRDAVVLVTRGLLDGLDRDETEAVAARLVSQIGAGDLRVAAGVTAVFRTFGFFLTVLDLVVRWTAWRTLGGFALLALTPRPGVEALARVGAGLEDGLQAETIPDVQKIMDRVPRPLHGIVSVLLFPWLLPMILSSLYKLVLFLWTAFFLGPPMAGLWKSRCYWTDAQTVKLARAPEAFARALEKIGAQDPPPGAETHAWLFIGAPTAARRAANDRKSMTLALPPAMEARIARLSAMGAGVRTGRNAAWSQVAGHPGRAAAVGCLGLVLAPLIFALVCLIGYLTAIVMTMGLAAGLGLVVWLI